MPTQNRECDAANKSITCERKSKFLGIIQPKRVRKRFNGDSGGGEVAPSPSPPSPPPTSNAMLVITFVIAETTTTQFFFLFSLVGRSHHERIVNKIAFNENQRKCF